MQCFAHLYVLMQFSLISPSVNIKIDIPAPPFCLYNMPIFDLVVNCRMLSILHQNASSAAHCRVASAGIQENKAAANATTDATGNFGISLVATRLVLVLSHKTQRTISSLNKSESASHWRFDMQTSLSACFFTARVNSFCFLTDASKTL